MINNMLDVFNYIVKNLECGINFQIYMHKFTVNPMESDTVQIMVDTYNKETNITEISLLVELDFTERNGHIILVTNKVAYDTRRQRGHGKCLVQFFLYLCQFLDFENVTLTDDMYVENVPYRQRRVEELQTDRFQPFTDDHETPMYHEISWYNKHFNARDIESMNLYTFDCKERKYIINPRIHDMYTYNDMIITLPEFSDLERRQLKKMLSEWSLECFPCPC